MFTKKISHLFPSVVIVLALLTSAVPALAAPNPAPLFADSPNPPAETVKLIFIHHSTGENWLADGYGNLGIVLGQNNYFVSGTNYGWGPNAIGDRTDIPDWTEWFRSGDTATYMNALFNESEQNSSYTRTLADPGGENEIIMFKSCFPNSALDGNPDDPPDPNGWLTVGHAKYVYNEILEYFATKPDKLFIVITAPPLQDGTYAENARAFNEWLMNDWLAENSYTQPNVAVFDFYNVLTGPNNHHRYINGAIEHVFTPGMNTSYYPSSAGDDHPNATGSQKATAEFVPLLNIFYNRWKNTTPSTFTDVPVTHPLYEYIEALWDAGYTAGCSTSPLMFCPDTILDRAQSAVFMLRGQLGANYTPPPAPWNTFADDWTGFEWAEPWAQGMWDEGLTQGCQTSPLMYCPATQLPRVEASVFGLRMKYGVDYTPPDASGTLFADFPSTDPSYWAIDWAEQAYLDGLLPACGTQNGKPMFCPSQLVNRGWGAYLIVKAKNLPLP